MSGAIGPGDWVECVDASPNRRIGRSVLAHKALYQVERAGFVTNLPALWLVGLRSLGTTGAFDARRFRPIYRPKADLIETLKQPVYLPEWGDLPEQKPLDVPA